MFGWNRKQEEPEEKPAAGPRGRAGLYAMGGLYLGYLLYQLAGPCFVDGAAAPPVPALLLGTVVLGGGMAVLFYLAWRMYRVSLSAEEDGGAADEDPGLLRDGCEAEECEDGEDEEI